MSQPVPPPVSEDVQWYLRHHDEVVHGPYEFVDIKQAEELGRISESTQLRHPECTNDQWEDARTVIDRIVPVSESPPIPEPVSQSDFQIAGLSIDDFKKHWPSHPGKRITAAATIAWLLGLPICYLKGIASAYRGSRVIGGGHYYFFQNLEGLTIEAGRMHLRESFFVWKNVTPFSFVCAAVAISGIVLFFVSPSKDNAAST